MQYTKSKKRAAFSSLLTAALLFGATLAHAQARAEFYVVKARPDGTSYLGSDMAIPENATDPSDYILEQAVNIGETELIHYPTGIHLPRHTSSCTLQTFGGIERGAPSGFVTMRYGAKGFYTCDPSFGPAFVLYAMETQVYNPNEVTPSPVPTLASFFMRTRPNPADVTCDEPVLGDVTKQWCRHSAVVNGTEIVEFGVVVSKGDSFLRANAASLPEQYEAAKRGLDQWLSDIAVERLDQDRPPRS